MQSKEDAGGSSREKLKIRSDVDVSGRKLTPQDPVTFNHHSSSPLRPARRRGIGRWFFLLLLLLLGKLGYDFYRFQQEAQQVMSTLNYGATCTEFLDQVFAPLDTETPNPIKHLYEFRGQCSSRLQEKKPDAELAAAALQLCNRLMVANTTRENYETTYRFYTTVPPSVLDRNRADVEESERTRRVQYYANNLAIQPWQAYVQRERPDCANLLQRLVAHEKMLATPRGLLLQLRLFGWGYTQALLNRMPESWRRMVLPEKPKAVPCSACRGTGWLPCSACQGAGQIQREVQTTCQQCKGSGVYQRRLSSSSVKCPFCKGQGQLTQTKTEACTVCRGTGRQICSACSGTGVAEQEK